MNRRDQLGNALVRVQEVSEGGVTRFEVVDKRRRSGERVVASYEVKTLADAHAEMLWRTP